MTTKLRVARPAVPAMPIAEGGATIDETLTATDAHVAPVVAVRMTTRPPRVTTTTPGVLRKVMPR